MAGGGPHRPPLNFASMVSLSRVPGQLTFPCVPERPFKTIQLPWPPLTLRLGPLAGGLDHPRLEKVAEGVPEVGGVQPCYLWVEDSRIYRPQLGEAEPVGHQLECYPGIA